MPLFVTVTPGTTVTNSTTLDATTLNLLGTPSVDVTGTVDGGSLTLSAGSVTTVAIADNAVTFAKLDNIDGDRLIGRDDAGSGDPTQISVGGGLQFTGSNSIEIGNGLVTYAKIQNTAAGKRLIGRAGTAAGTVGEIEVGTGLNLSDGGVLTASSTFIKYTSPAGIGVPASAGGQVTPVEHQLSGVPSIFRVYARCVDASGSTGYSVNDIVPIECFMANGYTSTPFVNWADASYLGLRRNATNPMIYLPHKTTGIAVQMTNNDGTVSGSAQLTKWNILFEAVRFT